MHSTTWHDDSPRQDHLKIESCSGLRLPWRSVAMCNATVSAHAHPPSRTHSPRPRAMSPDIQASILMLEIFEPGNGMGYGTEAMLLHSSELREVSDGELMLVLQDMEREALITREEEWYRSTRLGQVARQQLMTQQGLTTEPLSKQTNYCPADLILAIDASHQVSLEIQSEVIANKEFDVHLTEFPATQHKADLATKTTERT